MMDQKTNDILRALAKGTAVEQIADVEGITAEQVKGIKCNYAEQIKKIECEMGV